MSFNDSNQTTKDKSGFRVQRAPRKPQCDFCGTTEKTHNITRKRQNDRVILLCDNPVCNKLPGLTDL